MADTLVHNGYRKILMNRGNKSTPDYTPPSDLFLSTEDTDPSIGDLTIEGRLPIANGTVFDDGSNNFTGSDGGDNSTDNTTTYKEGAGITDVTAQNLIANATSVHKKWEITLGANLDPTEYVGCWIYIKDQTTMDKLYSSSGTLLLKFIEDASNYYYLEYPKVSLSVGWNWVSPGKLNTLLSIGSPSTTINQFSIKLQTINATDTFAAGDVIYDLLRQWDDSDQLQALTSGYPSLDETKMQSTHSFILTTAQANGFLVPKFVVQNDDSTPLFCFETLTDGDSKSSSEQWRINFKTIHR